MVSRIILFVVLVGSDGRKKKQVPVDPQQVLATESVDALLERARNSKLGYFALQKLQDAVKADPGNDQLHAALGMASLRVKEKEKDGVRHLRTALTINPGFPGLHQQLGVKLAERTPEDAWARNEALALFKTALLLNPIDGDVYFQVGKLQQQLDGKDKMGKPLPLWTTEEWAFEVGNRHDSVATQWRIALEIKPDLWSAHREMALRLIHSSVGKRRKQALRHAEQAVELAPSHAAAYYALAGTTLRQAAPIAAGPLSVDNASAALAKPRAAAIDALRRAVRMKQPKNQAHADEYYTLGLLLLTARSNQAITYRDALTFFEAALNIRPQDERFAIAARNCRGHLMAQGRAAENQEQEDDDE